MKLKIRKGDIVRVITGKGSYKKLTGKVLKVIPEKQKLIVTGVNLRKKHQKQTSMQKQGGIIERENPIHISNVMLICQKCEKPTRVRYELSEQGGSFRVCRKCGAIIKEG
jgi:large subunit ribosomal protein L24